jgi:hypothetical protein
MPCTILYHSGGRVCLPMRYTCTAYQHQHAYITKIVISTRTSDRHVVRPHALVAALARVQAPTPNPTRDGSAGRLTYSK